MKKVLENLAHGFAVLSFFFAFSSHSQANQDSILEESNGGGSEQPTGATKCNNYQWKDLKYVDGTFVRGVDGDTVRVKVDKKEYAVRMLTIDTPETHYQGMSQGFWGEKASDFLKSKTKVGAPIRLEFEYEQCDKYGRVLAYVWYGKVNLNYMMVEEGFAIDYCIYPNIKYCEEFGKAVEKNQEAKNNIFSDPAFVEPYEWRRKVSNRPNEKYVGDIRTRKVFSPGSLDKVDLAYRVFFMNKADIPPSYHLEN